MSGNLTIIKLKQIHDIQIAPERNEPKVIISRFFSHFPAFPQMRKKLNINNVYIVWREKVRFHGVANPFKICRVLRGI